MIKKAFFVLLLVLTVLTFIYVFTYSLKVRTEVSNLKTLISQENFRFNALIEQNLKQSFDSAFVFEENISTDPIRFILAVNPPICNSCFKKLFETYHHMENEPIILTTEMGKFTLKYFLKTSKVDVDMVLNEKVQYLQSNYNIIIIKNSKSLIIPLVKEQEGKDITNIVKIFDNETLIPEISIN